MFPIITKEEFAQKLKELRIRNKKTQKEIAEIIGRTQQIVGHWETGYSQPSAETFLLLCDIYKVENILEEFKRGTNLDNTPQTLETEKKSNFSESDKGIIQKFLQLNERNKIKIEGKIEDYLEEQQKTHMEAANEIMALSVQDAQDSIKNISKIAPTD